PPVQLADCRVQDSRLRPRPQREPDGTLTRNASCAPRRDVYVSAKSGGSKWCCAVRYPRRTGAPTKLRDLLIWSIVVQRTDMARISWRQTSDTIASALWCPPMMLRNMKSLAESEGFPRGPGGECMEFMSSRLCRPISDIRLLASKSHLPLWRHPDLHLTTHAHTCASFEQWLLTHRLPGESPVPESDRLRVSEFSTAMLKDLVQRGRGLEDGSAYIGASRRLLSYSGSHLIDHRAAASSSSQIAARRPLVRRKSQQRSQQCQWRDIQNPSFLHVRFMSTRHEVKFISTWPSLVFLLLFSFATLVTLKAPRRGHGGEPTPKSTTPCFSSPSLVVSFLLAYGVAAQALLYPNSPLSWKLIKDVVYLPYWQMYGELQLGDILADDDKVSPDSPPIMPSNVTGRGFEGGGEGEESEAVHSPLHTFDLRAGKLAQAVGLLPLPADFEFHHRPFLCHPLTVLCHIANVLERFGEPPAAGRHRQGTPSWWHYDSQVSWRQAMPLGAASCAAKAEANTRLQLQKRQPDGPEKRLRRIAERPGEHRRPELPAARRRAKLADIMQAVEVAQQFDCRVAAGAAGSGSRTEVAVEVGQTKREEGEEARKLRESRLPRPSLRAVPFADNYSSRQTRVSMIWPGGAPAHAVLLCRRRALAASAGEAAGGLLSSQGLHILPLCRRFHGNVAVGAGLAQQEDCKDRTGSHRIATGSHWIAQDATRSHRIALDRTRSQQDRTGSHRIGSPQDRTGSHRIALDRTDRTGSHKIAQDRTGSHRIAQDRTGSH
uniref:Exostosin domain-containing protein n=1 Tax=Macrostomum lignano TaxID=282301 RepID=A0A1I8FLK3_9PLAT